MGKKDSRIDAYIAKSADFARPILRHLRDVVHKGCPEVEETIKWGMPAFEHKGILGGMAAFKAHCAFNLWKGSLLGAKNRDAMGQFGRITSLSDLPKESVLLGYVREAARLNEEGVKAPRAPRPAKKPVETPADLASALKKNAKARATFEGFSPSHKREYVEWITEAKTDETRGKRLGTAIEWMAQGKPRMWRHMRKGAGRS